MQRASMKKQRSLVAAFALAAVLLRATEPVAVFVPASRSGTLQAARACAQTTHPATSAPSIPEWFPFSDVLNGWLHDALASVTPENHAMSLEEYAAMNDDLASMRARLQAAREREQQALEAIAELELEMEQDRLDAEDPGRSRCLESEIGWALISSPHD